MSAALNAGEREAYLSMAGRHARPGAGTHPSVLRDRTAQHGVPPVARYLGAVPFVVVGGVATRLYMPERMTLDVDVLVAPSLLDDAERALAATGCTRLGSLKVGGSSWRLPDGSVLDLLALPEP